VVVLARPEPITGFVVSDNGEGFHDQNMKSFELLDSEYRADSGCRGVGRLLWLKAFDKVEVASRYLDINMKEREFVFTARDGVSDQTMQDSLATETGSDVRLLGFREPYRQYAPKSGSPWLSGLGLISGFRDVSVRMRAGRCSA
jgi:hypothetical protein